MTYMVMANVNGKEYMAKVEARSAYEAEHMILDLGHAGRHEYGVNGALAFEPDQLKTDHFINCMLVAELVSHQALALIISNRNAAIKARDKAEDDIRRIEKQMAELAAELEAARQILAA